MFYKAQPNYIKLLKKKKSILKISLDSITKNLKKKMKDIKKKQKDFKDK